MLFRPRTEKRILRFHVLFTPGIILKNRSERAESIARVVAGEVISQEADDRAAHLAHFTAAGYSLGVRMAFGLSLSNRSESITKSAGFMVPASY